MKRTKRKLIVLLSVFSLFVGAVTAYAFVPSGVKWSDTAFTYNYDGLSANYWYQFYAARDDWNATNTKIDFAKVSAGEEDVTVDGAYYGNTAWNAVSNIEGSGTTITHVDMSANYSHMDVYDENGRRGIFGHEWGHVFGLAHVSETNILMFGSANKRTVYTPQTDDVDGVNSIYP